MRSYITQQIEEAQRVLHAMRDDTAQQLCDFLLEVPSSDTPKIQEEGI